MIYREPGSLKTSLLNTILLSVLLFTSVTVPAQTTFRIDSNERFMKIRSKRLEFVISRHSSQSINISKLATSKRPGILFLPAEAQAQPAPIWQLEFYEPGLSFNSNAARFISWQAQKNDSGVVAKFNWKAELSGSQFQINMEIQFLEKRSSTFWRLEVTSADGMPFTLRRCVFPIMGDFIPSSPSRNIRLASPYSWGYEYLQAEKADYQARYPSNAASMQFMAYYDDRTGEGLYIAALDTSGYQKLFANHKGNPQFPYARAEISVFPENRAVEKWSMPYPVEIKPYQGNWYEAAKFYREWVTQNASWCIPNRQKNASWLWDNILWINAEMPSDTNYHFLNTPDTEYFVKLAEYCKVPTAIHLYNWHHYPFNDMFPYFFPPRKGFSEFLQKMQEHDVRVVPYINARIADLRILNSEAEYRDNACAEKLDSIPEFKTYRYWNHDFVTMCPATSFWQNTIFSIAQKLQGDYGFPGIFFDQVCNTYAFKCVNPGHGHIPDPPDRSGFSSGTHWVQGYRKMFQQINTQIITERNFINVSEDGAEPWNDLIDAFLMIHAQISDKEQNFRVIPLYPAVYGGYTIPIAFGYNNPPVDEYVRIFSYKLAKSFLWGSQLGWIRPKDFYQHPVLLNFLKELCQVRYAVRNYLNFGEMLAEPEQHKTASPLNINEMITEDEATYYPITFRDYPLLVSFWKLNSDSSVVLATNYSDMDFSNSSDYIVLNHENYGLEEGKYQINLITSGGATVRIDNVDTSRIFLDLKLLPYSAIAYELVRRD